MKVSTLIWPYSKAQFMMEHLLLSLMSQFKILYYDFDMIHMIGNQAGLYYITEHNIKIILIHKQNKSFNTVYALSGFYS